MARLLERCREHLLRMVRARLDRRIAARIDAADVVQETLLEASRQLEDYLRTRPLPFLFWMRQIAAQRLDKTHRRHLFAKKRSVKREVSAALPISHYSTRIAPRGVTRNETTPGETALRNERADWVRRNMARLSRPDREILNLRHVEQLSMRQIGLVLGVSETAAKSRHYRALHRLEQLLENSVDPGQ